jgi:hypothetical protein
MDILLEGRHLELRTGKLQQQMEILPTGRLLELKIGKSTHGHFASGSPSGVGNRKVTLASGSPPEDENGKVNKRTFC